MALHWRPVGPLPPATYWRRRALVAVLLVALLAGLAWAVRGLGSGDDRLEPRAQPTPSATAADEPDPEPSTTPEPAALCADDDLEVQARTDLADHAVGASAVLTLSVRNTGSSPCRRALGQGAVELVIFSGEDRIWSSDDCAPGGDQGEVTLAPGASQAARATWPGTRSAPGCPPDQRAAAPGTYQITGRVGELRVKDMVFRVRD